jgi:hypothetical protein
MELAKNLEFQDKLRAEIHSALGAGIKNVAYDSMPLLNGFIKVSFGKPNQSKDVNQLMFSS